MEVILIFLEIILYDLLFIILAKLALFTLFITTYTVLPKYILQPS